MTDRCEGHESLNGADMGVTVFCDGSCNPIRLFASRNSVSAWRDEDRAMAHEHWGPFTSEDEARAELVFRMREEAAYFSGHNGARATILTEAADKIETEKLNECQRSGLVWKIGPYAY